ncbi:MAG: hypothetical protein ABJA50_11040, partial [Chloroflexota bacterium]
PGVTSIVSAVTPRGGEVQVQIPDAPSTLGASGQEGGPSGLGAEGQGKGKGGVPPADMALLISAGLGLKRALPWAQVKGALVQASISDARDPKHEPVQMVSEGLGVPSLRTSMAPVRRFVDTARSIGMPAADVATVLDVAASAADIGEVIATIHAEDETTRHSRWGATGVSPAMLHPLEIVRSNILRRAVRSSPAGTQDHKALERAQEMLGTLLIEGVSIHDELDSVPIETYSAHPFTLGGSGAAVPLAAYSTGRVVAAMPEDTQPKSVEKVLPHQRASRPGKKQSRVPPPTAGPISRSRTDQAPGSLLPVSQAGVEGPDIPEGTYTGGTEHTPPRTPDVAPDRDEETGGNDAPHQS